MKTDHVKTDLEKNFSAITWENATHAESRSGDGSTVKYTQPLRSALPLLFQLLNLRAAPFGFEQPVVSVKDTPDFGNFYERNNRVWSRSQIRAGLVRAGMEKSRS